jgi:hypothetical protein
MNTTTMGARRWPVGVVTGLLGGGVDDAGGGADCTVGAELPPAHPAQAAATRHRMKTEAPRTGRSLAGGD